jgi:hypothetical protein
MMVTVTAWWICSWLMVSFFYFHSLSLGKP